MVPDSAAREALLGSGRRGLAGQVCRGERVRFERLRSRPHCFALQKKISQPRQIRGSARNSPRSSAVLRHGGCMGGLVPSRLRALTWSLITAPQRDAPARVRATLA